MDVAGLLNNLAATAERAARYRRAVKHLGEARDLARRAGDVEGEAQMLLNAAVVHAKRGALGPAWNTCVELLERRRHLPEHLMAGAAEQLADVARLAGHGALARQHFGAALAAFEALGDERRAAGVRCALALLDLRSGDALGPSGAGDGGAGDAVVGSVRALEGAGGTQLAAWYWAGLALVATAPAEVRAGLDGAAAGTRSPHLELVIAMARLRTELRRQRAVPPFAERPCGALTEAAAAVRAGAGREVVERPHALVLLSLAAEVGAGQPATTGAADVGGEGAAAALQSEAEALVGEQGAGLPATLRTTLADQPRRWRALAVCGWD